MTVSVAGPARGWVVLTAAVGRDLTPRAYRSTGEAVTYEIVWTGTRFAAVLLTPVTIRPGSVGDAHTVTGWALLSDTAVRPLWSQLLEHRDHRDGHVLLQPRRYEEVR